MHLEEIGHLLDQVKEYSQETEEGDVGELLDHIFGYKKIRDYELDM